MLKIVKVITFTAIVVILGIVGNVLWKGNTETMKNLEVANSAQQYGVEVISSNAPNFNDELMRYIGGRSNVIPLVEASKPFVIFVKNNSSNDIVGICLRWRLVKTNGEITEADQFESTPGILMGMKPYDPFMVGKTSLVNSNSLKFFSYFQPPGAVLYNLHKSVRSGRVEYNPSPQQIQDYVSTVAFQKRVLLNDVIDVSVTVDGVIFSDGTCVGENRSFFFESINGTLQAKKDFLRKLKEAKRLNKNETDALNEFISDASKIESAPKDRRPKLKYQDGNEAFDQSYRFYTVSLIREIYGKRQKAKDSYITEDFLAVKDSDIIPLKRK